MTALSRFVYPEVRYAAALNARGLIAEFRENADGKITVTPGNGKTFPSIEFCDRAALKNNKGRTVVPISPNQFKLKQSVDMAAATLGTTTLQALPVFLSDRGALPAIAGAATGALLLVRHFGARAAAARTAAIREAIEAGNERLLRMSEEHRGLEI